MNSLIQLWKIVLIACWNMVMASVITIPLYKLLCNLTIIEDIGTISNITSLDWLVVDMMYAKDTYSSNTESCTLDVMFHQYETYWSYLDTKNAMHDKIFVNCPKMKNIEIRDIIDGPQISIKFITHVSNASLVEFISLQEEMIVQAGESSLIFFRIYNPSMYQITCISMYYIFPGEASPYVSKIQCFCFDQLRINGHESVELPVLYYIERSLLQDNIRFDNTMYISYVIFTQK